MKLSKAHLKKDIDEQLRSMYSFFAEESIQISELVDLVTKKAKLESFEEKQTHIVSKDTDWSFLNLENEKTKVSHNCGYTSRGNSSIYNY